MKSEFINLKKKIFIEVITIVAVSVLVGMLILVLFVDGIFEKPFAEGFVSLCQRVFQVDYYGAVAIYNDLFRSNKVALIAAGFCVMLMVVFYVALSRFRRYFKEINGGIDRLLDKEELPIVLAPELDFMADKLNSAKVELKKREVDALESERRKNELVVYLAHDIRTPLTSVLGYLSLLEETHGLTDEMQKKYINIALTKAQNLESLVNELFEITRYNSEALSLEKKKVNLSMMLLQMVDEFYPQFSEKGNQAVTEIQEGIFLNADGEKLARALGNIIKNAISYGAPGKPIVIRAFFNEREVFVEVENEGSEIPKEKLDRIFEKFYRAEEARSGSSGNAGLGLAIAREIVTRHGGNISVRSDDEKTIFKIVIPF